MNLRHTTRDIVGQVEHLTGFPVEVVEDRALPAPAGMHRAGRRSLPGCAIRYSPAARRSPRFAPQAYVPLLEFHEFGPTADLAREGRTRMAERGLRGGAVGGLRMDAVWTMASAPEVFEAMTPEQVQPAGLERALLGRRGLDISKSEPTYTLRTLPGEYSALNVVAIMVAAFEQFAPGTDLGIDLAREYEAAVQMRRREPGEVIDW